MRALLAGFLFLGSGFVLGSPAAGPSEASDQFQSVIYMRGVHPYFPEGREVARVIRPHTFMHPQFYGPKGVPFETTQPAGYAEAKGWGARYIGGWGRMHPAFMVDETLYPGLVRGQIPPALVPSKMPPLKGGEQIEGLNARTIFHWDHWKKLGVLTGEKPRDIRDWLFVTEKEARERRKGDAAELNSREMPPFLLTERSLPVSMFNPEVIRFFSDYARDLVRRKYYFDEATASEFTDIAGTSGLDFSEHSRAAFEKMLRESYSKKEIAEIFQIDPEKAIPLLPPEGASEELERNFQIERAKLFTKAYGMHYSAVRQAVREASNGRINLNMIKNGACFSWHAYGNLQGIYPIYWGDAINTYMSEGGSWPGTGMRSSYTGISFSDVEQNIFDYMYGSGRLWGEPVILKNFYHRVRNPFPSQLAVAEGMAMLGNAGLYAKYGDARSRARGTEVDYRWPLPMVDFAHRITPRIRQMIPSAEVGIVYSSVDRMAEFTEHIENTFELCDMLTRQNVPFQFIHLELLEKTLQARGPRVLILPWLRCVSDAQAAVLEAHVRAGGSIIFIGPNGTHNGGSQRKKAAFTALAKAPNKSGMGIRKVGKGRTVAFDGLLAGYDVASNILLRRALLEAAGHDPSAVRLSRETAPLFFNLTRNSNRSRFWLHALNYDVDLLNWKCDSTVLVPRRDLKTGVNLPPDVRVQALRLLRPGLPEDEIPFRETAEGCEFTLPWLDLYALVEMDTVPGSRKGRTTTPNANPVREVADMLSSTDWKASGRWQTVGDSQASARPANGPQKLMYGTRTHVTVGATKKIEMEVWVSDSSPGDMHRHPLSYVVHDQTGAPVNSGVLPPGKHKVSVAVPAAGAYALTFRAGQRWPSGGNAYSVRFTHPGGAVFEASEGMPFGTCVFESGTPFYFYVPKETRTFDVAVHTPCATKTRAKTSRIVVRDPSGVVVLDGDGMFGAKPPSLNGEGFDYEDSVPVPTDQAGKVWSVEFPGQPGTGGGREDTRFWMKGVPPLLSETPSQLIVPGSVKIP